MSVLICFPGTDFIALLSVIHTATVCWDVYKVSIERAQSRETPKSGGTGRIPGALPERKAGADHLELPAWSRSKQIAGCGGQEALFQTEGATIIRKAGEMRLPSTPAFWPIT